jgi:flagella basal body P-ring formation protein FlgA
MRGFPALWGLAVACLFLLGAAPAALADPQAPEAARRVQGAEMAELEEIVVRVLPNPEVSSDTYTLGEIAEFDGFDVEGAAALASLSMGRSPNPGRPLPLSEPLIRSRLAGSAQVGHVRIVVPRNAQVLRAAQTITAADIEAVIRAQALKDAGGESSQVKQEILTPLSDLSAPKGAVEWQVELLGKHLVPGGDRTYQATALVDGKEVWRMPVRVRQKVYRTVVVAKRPIRRDQLIKPEDVTTLRRTAGASKEAGFTGDPSAIVGMKAKRPIAQDEPISEGIVRAPAAVSEGGRVQVVFETNLLSMQVPGVALVAGQIGQFIPVRNLETGKIVYGIVQADERVKVN